MQCEGVSQSQTTPTVILHQKALITPLPYLKDNSHTAAPGSLQGPKETSIPSLQMPALRAGSFDADSTGSWQVRFNLQGLGFAPPGRQQLQHQESLLEMY